MGETTTDCFRKDSNNGRADASILVHHLMIGEVMMIPVNSACLRSGDVMTFCFKYENRGLHKSINISQYEKCCSAATVDCHTQQYSIGNELLENASKNASKNAVKCIFMHSHL